MKNTYQENIKTDIDNVSKYRKHLKSLILRGHDFKEDLGQTHYKIEFKINNETIIYEQFIKTEYYYNSKDNVTQKFEIENHSYWEDIKNLVTDREYELDEIKYNKRNNIITNEKLFLTI